MKKVLGLLLMGALLAGCGSPPASVKNTLYSTELALRLTAAEAAAGTRDPWVVPAGADAGAKLAIRERQVDYLLILVDQSARNLESVRNWFRFGDPNATGPGQ